MGGKWWLSGDWIIVAKKGVERFCGWRVSKGEDSLDSRQTTTAIRLDARHVHPQSTSSATNASRLCDYSPQYSSKVSSGFRTIHTHLPSYHPRHPHTYLTHSENRGFSLVAYTLTPQQLHSSVHFERTPCIGAVNLAMARTTRSSAAQQEKPSDDSERQSSTSSPPSNRLSLSTVSVRRPLFFQLHARELNGFVNLWMMTLMKHY